MSVATSTPRPGAEAGAGAEAGPEAPDDVNNPESQASLDSTITVSRSRFDDQTGADRVGTRSCYSCHRRKVGCDKRQPCSNCSRTGKPCVYPPAGQIRRPRKKTITWVADRLSQLEKFLPAGADDEDPNRLHPGSSPTPPSTKASSSHVVGESTASPAEADQVFGDEVLMQKGPHSQYFNEILLSKVIREQRDIQSVLTTPESRREDLRDVSIANPMGILSAPSSNRSFALFPAKETALKLWNIYCERVESCTGMKVLHLPTDEVRIYAAIEQPSGVDAENLALCFAVFYAATSSLQPSETQSLLIGDAATNLAQFKAGYEQSLAETNILDNPTRTLLCSMAIYLSALRLYNRGKGVWVLHGLAIRMAQAMGLHRDGERLGLSPFESELRRRVWWHFFGRDSRAAEDYGLQKVCNLRSDVDLPLNVDDADLHPDMECLPPPKPGVTSMTFPLVTYEIARAVHRLAGILAGATSASPPKESVRKQVIDETRARIEMSLKQCNLVIPRHRLAFRMSHLALRKADFVSRQQWLALDHGDSREAFATEENLIEAIEVLEICLQMWNDEMLKPYWWLWKADPEYHVVMYLLWHLCVRPEGPNVDRAWGVVDLFFRLDPQAAEGPGSKGAVLLALRGKAEMIRSSSRGTGHTMGDTLDQEDHTSAWPVEQRANGADWTSRQRTSVGVEDGWLPDLGEVPAWTSLVDTFQLETQDFPAMFWQ